MAKGDHIWVRRGLYSHHGIDAGGGWVIHFTGEPIRKRNAIIKETSMEVFLGGGKLEVRSYASRPFDRDEVVRRAMSRLGQDGYHLVFDNCEHFARWCSVGEHVSGQVERTVAAGSAAFFGRLAPLVAPAAVGGPLFGALAGLGFAEAGRRTVRWWGRRRSA